MFMYICVYKNTGLQKSSLAFLLGEWVTSPFTTQEVNTKGYMLVTDDHSVAMHPTPFKKHSWLLFRLNTSQYIDITWPTGHKQSIAVHTHARPHTHTNMLKVTCLFSPVFLGCCHSNCSGYDPPQHVCLSPKQPPCSWRTRVHQNHPANQSEPTAQYTQACSHPS